MIVLISLFYYQVLFPSSKDYPFLDVLAFFEIFYKANGILYLIPLLYGALLLSWQASLAIWVIAFSVILPRLLFLTLSVSGTITNIMFALVSISLILSIQLEIKRRANERAMAAERERIRQDYMRLIFKAEDDERRRIAQELHDDTIQSLLVTANNAHSLSSADLNTAREVSEQINTTLLRVVEDLRRMTLELMPSILENLGLVPALSWLADCLQDETGMEVKFALHGSIRKLGSDSEISVFRIVQEALNNVKKHSGADVVKLDIYFNTDSLRIVVQDNGKGFYLSNKLGQYTQEGKMGLIGMRQRANFLGANLQMVTSPGKGATIKLFLKC